MLPGLSCGPLAILLFCSLHARLFGVADAAGTSDTRASPSSRSPANATSQTATAQRQLPEQLKGRRLIQRSPQTTPAQKIMASAEDDSDVWLSVDGTRTVTVTTAPLGSPCGAAHMTRSVCETPTATCTPDGNGKSTCHAVPKVEAISTVGEQPRTGVWLSSDAYRTIYITTASMDSRCGAAFGTRTVCPDGGKCTRLAGGYSTCSQSTEWCSPAPFPTSIDTDPEQTGTGVWLSSDASRTVTITTASANARCGAQFGTRTLCPGQYACATVANQGYSSCAAIPVDAETSFSSFPDQTPTGIWASVAPSTTIYITTAALGARCGAQFGTRTVCPGINGRCTSIIGKGISTCTSIDDASPTTSTALSSSSVSTSTSHRSSTIATPSTSTGAPTISTISTSSTSVGSTTSSSSSKLSLLTTTTTVAPSASSQAISTSTPGQNGTNPSLDIRDSFLVGGSVGTLPRLEALPDREYLDVSGTKQVDAMVYASAAGMNIARVHTTLGMAGTTLSFDNSEGWAEREKNYNLDWGGIDLQVSVAKRAQRNSMKIVHAVNMGQVLPPAWWNLTYTQVLGQIAIEVGRQVQPFLDAGIQADIVILGTEETDGMLYRQYDPVTGAWINDRGVWSDTKPAENFRQEVCGQIPTGNLASWPQLAGYYKHMVATIKKLITQSSRDPSRTLFGLHSHGQYFQFKNDIVYNNARSEQSMQSPYPVCDLKSIIPDELYYQSCSSVLDVMGWSGYPDPMHPTDLNGTGLSTSMGNINRNLAASQFIAEKYGRNENGRYKKVALLLETASAYDYNAAGIADQDTFTHIFLTKLLAEECVLGVLWWEPMYGRNYWMGGTAALTREWGASRLPARQAALTFYAYAKAKR